MDSFSPISQNNWFSLFGKAIILLVLFKWSHHLITSPRPWIILDAANLVFHEAGHVIFIITGNLGSYLGGSIMQLLIPVIILIYFMLKHQHFSAAFSTFWLGDSLVNVAIYMKDARTMSLNLIGGDHDWHYIFSQLGLLEQDLILGGFVRFLGSIAIIGSVIWMSVILIQSALSLLSSSSKF